MCLQSTNEFELQLKTELQESKLSVDFAPVGYLADFNDGKPHRVEVAGEDILIAVVDREVYAVSDTCTHGQVSLSDGELDDCKIECFLHGAAFDLKTGIPTSPPASDALATYEVALEGDDDNPQILVSTKAKEK
jgi:3-phenylpropionate/trans-cinnamate dioxygenase ferredoxin subunit